MGRIRRFLSRFGRRAAGRARQLHLFRRTGKAGHRKMAGRHGRAMRYLRRLIRREKRKRTNSGQLSPQGAAFIARFEGFSSTPYNDPVGHCTIGPGILLHHGNCTSEDHRRWGRISVEEGNRLLRQEADPIAAEILRLVEVPLAQYELDALASWGYNVGLGAVSASTLIERLNRGERHAVPAELAKWTLAGGHELAGLVRRRNAEGRMWADGVYQHN